MAFFSSFLYPSNSKPNWVNMMQKYLFVSSAIILAAALQVWSVTSEDASCASDDALVFSEPNLVTSTDALFLQRYNEPRFVIQPDAKLTAWDGSKRTADQHFDWMLTHVKKMVASETPGFKVTGERDGVVYEQHAGLTEAANGVGYFRLSAVVDISPKLFAALMGEPKMLKAMDNTIRIMDFSRSPSFPSNEAGKRKIWLCYFRQSPGILLPDLDGLDVSGWTIGDDGVVWQVAMGLPDLLPLHPATLTNLYPPAFRSLDMYWGYRLEPIGEGGTQTKLTLVCQHDLRNWMIPNFLLNRMVGDVLADYVRTAETVGKSIVERGEETVLLKRLGLLVA